MLTRSEAAAVEAIGGGVVGASNAITATGIIAATTSRASRPISNLYIVRPKREQQPRAQESHRRKREALPRSRHDGSYKGVIGRQSSQLTWSGRSWIV